MLDPKRWPAALAELAHTVAEAGRELQVRPVRIEEYDTTYELSVRIPRAAVGGARTKKEA